MGHKHRCGLFNKDTEKEGGTCEYFHQHCPESTSLSASVMTGFLCGGKHRLALRRVSD